MSGVPSPSPRDARPPLGAGRILAAFLVALAADATQIALLPLFAGGAIAPWEDALDLGVGLVLLALVGRHWALLPSFLAELVPGVDLAPSWTLAVWIATRGQRARRAAPPGEVPP
jgi:hypothetical protein